MTTKQSALRYLYNGVILSHGRRIPRLHVGRSFAFAQDDAHSVNAYRRRTTGLFAILCAIFLCALPSSAHAETTVTVSTDELVADAAQIFVGTCQHVEVVTDARGLTVTELTFAVDEAFKGPVYDDHLATSVFRMIGIQHAMRVDQSYLLFLHAPSQWDFSSPVGGNQGIVPMSRVEDPDSLFEDIRQHIANTNRKPTTEN